ncbi:MAG: Ig-like domain-containing protein [Planctomycetota bacterium]
MNLSLRARLLATASLGLAAACSSSSSSDLTVAGSVTQDLTTDPNGFVTAVEFDRALASLGAGAFESDGGQTAVSVSLDGTTAYVTWDERVTSNDRVRVVGVNGVLESWRRVTAEDARQPSLTITAATQDVSDQALGGDELVITFGDGPRVIEEEAEDPATWTLTALGVPQDLSDSTFDLDVTTQVLTVTLGPSAQLFSAFQLQANALTAVNGRALASSPIAGVASGDSAAPALEGGSPVVQNLDPSADGDEFGRVVEFNFDEPISPTFSVTASNFEVQDHADAQGLTLVSNAEVDATDNSILRVTFTRPVVPGLDRIIVNSIRDAHGNPFPRQTLSFVPSSSIANGFESVEGLTREGQNNDQVLVVLDQALDPDTAADATAWSLTLGAPFGVIDLATQELSYDLLARTLTIDLDFDVPNGTTVDVQCNGAIDVDGDAFAATAAQVLADGDVSAPIVTASGITQRRDLDPSGKTIDVVFSEAVDSLVAEDVNSYAFSPVVVVDSATVQADGLTVRLALASAAVPGIHTLTVAATVADPAGNALGAVHGPAAIATTDAVQPLVQFVTGQAVEGADNDRLLVLFDDWMVASDVEDVDNWEVESPIGTALDVSTSTVTYDEESRVATLVLASGAVKRGDDLSIALTAGRDLGGNALADDAIEGVVGGESRRPALESVWRHDAPDDHLVVVRFSEAVDRLDDLYDPTTNPTGAKFTLYTSGGVLRGRPASTTILDGGLGVELAFPFTVDLTDTLDVVGLEDLAGNVMFPTLARVVDAEDSTAPSQGAAPVMTAISGERNDTIEVTFAVPMASWGLSVASQYTLQTNGGATVIDLTGSQFEYDGGTTLTITLSAAAAASLQAGTSYDLVFEVDATDPLRTQQGVALTAQSSELAVVVVGDITSGPTQGASRALLDPSDANSVLIVFDEAVAEAAAETAAAYDYDSGNVALTAELISPRVVRATVGVAVAAGNTVDVATSAAVDLAGNAAAATLTLSIVDDQNPPVLAAVVGTVLDVAGTDMVSVRFSEVPDLATALDLGNYSVLDSRGSVQIQSVAYSSVGSEVILYTAELLDGDTVTVLVDGVTDLAGNLPVVPLSLGGLVGGDSIAPAISGAFVNLMADPTGATIDVEFSEAVETVFSGQVSNWSTTGAATVTAVDVLAGDHVRVTLSAALGASEELVLAAGLTDRSGNSVATTLSVEPAQ